MNGSRLYISRDVNYGLRSHLTAAAPPPPKKGPRYSEVHGVLALLISSQAFEFSGDLKGPTRRPKATVYVEDLHSRFKH